MCSGTPRDTYGDVPGLLARYRDAGPSIRRAKASGVLVSQSTIGFLGFSEGGNEYAGVSGVSLTGCSFFVVFVVRGSPAEPQTVSLGSGASLQRSTQRSPTWGIRGFETRITIPLQGRALHFPPSKEQRPGLLYVPIHRSAWKVYSPEFGVFERWRRGPCSRVLAARFTNPRANR